MYDRMTVNLRRLMHNARIDSQKLGYTVVMAESLAACIFQDPGCTAYRALKALHVDEDELDKVLRSRCRQQDKPGREPVERMSLGDCARVVMEKAEQESRVKWHTCLDTGHLLHAIQWLRPHWFPHVQYGDMALAVRAAQVEEEVPPVDSACLVG